MVGWKAKEGIRDCGTIASTLCLCVTVLGFVYVCVCVGGGGEGGLYW